MRKSLRVPAALAFVVSGTVAAVVACGDDAPPPTDASCAVYCVPIGSDSSNCPPYTVCVSGSGTCPTGCEPEPIV